MAVVRYAVLVALVLWLGWLVDGLTAAPIATQPWWLPYPAGGVIVVGLFVVKFIGPPPHGFVPRAAIAVLMLLLTLADQFLHLRALLLATLGLGLVLLTWYAHE